MAPQTTNFFGQIYRAVMLDRVIKLERWIGEEGTRSRFDSAWWCSFHPVKDLNRR